MNLFVNQTVRLNGHLTPPGSKSQSIRGLMLASMCRGESTLKNILHSDDTQDAIHVCQSLGVTIGESKDLITVTSKGLPFDAPCSEIYSGNSGLATLFIMPILGLRRYSSEPIILNCGEQMRQRPIKPLVDALRNLGLTIQYLKNENTLPIRISGELAGGVTNVEGFISQYLSALLLALPCASGDSEITVKNLQERPYVEMTLNWLKEQNILFHHISNAEMDIFKIKGGQCYQEIHTIIPGDFSSASYLIAACVLIPGEVKISGLNMEDVQGDKKLIAILQEMGADILVKPEYLLIRGGKKLTGIKIDAHDIPDLLPVLAVIGTAAFGKTEIRNVAHARIKETDRIRSMANGLSRMGASLIEESDGLIIFQSQLQGASVKGYGDHRTVMALSIAGMIAEGSTLIDDSESIDKTFPSFVSTMTSIGAKMEVRDGITA